MAIGPLRMRATAFFIGVGLVGLLRHELKQRSSFAFMTRKSAAWMRCCCCVIKSQLLSALRTLR